MRKFVLSSIAAAMFSTGAHAIDLGVSGSRTDGENEYTVSVSVPQDKLSVGVALSRSTGQWKPALTAGYDVFTYGNFSAGPQVGVAWLFNKNAQDGAAIQAGIGASYALTKDLAITADYSRQWGQERVNEYDQTQFGVGIKVSF